MKSYAQCDNVQHKSQIDFSTLDSAIRRELVDALNKGALSRCETLLSALEEGECKRWIAERLSQMDFETIRNSILSA